MKLKCGKCQTEFVVPPEVLSSPEPRAECPNCGARYRLKPRTGLLPTAAQTGDIQLRTTPSLPMPAATAPPAVNSPVGTGPQPANVANRTTPLQMPQASSTADPEGVTVVSTGGLSAGRLRLGGPVFSSGDLVSQRYRIVRFLAQGGMGEVYEAEDIELRQEVALKTVSAHIGGDPAAVDRFKREIALARRVTHPNVCRIFDLGQHLLPDFADGIPMPPLTFLTMELLRGETLSQLLKRRGRLTPEEAFPLIEQMAAALDAAHRANIVHRDFKSENVFLVEDPAKGGLRAVVTDFGVARGADHNDRFAAQVTGLGIVGTPAYMAPEQVENKEITASADLYALGIVIYEMVTGRLPFESPNPLTTAVKRLKEAPPPPHALVPDLPAFWEKAILRCLERAPQDRFANVLELVEALRKPVRGPRPAEAARPEAASGGDRHEPHPPRPQASLPAVPPPPPPKTKAPAATRSRSLLITLLVVVLVSAALATFNYLKRDRPAGAVQLRRAVAVFGLNNLTTRADAAWISTAVAEMLSSELGRGDNLRTISGQEITDARRELQLEDLNEPSRAELEKVRGRLGCDFVVAGSYVSIPGAAGEQLRIDLHVHDAVAGNRIATISESGNLADLITIVGKLGQGLHEKLGSEKSAEEGDSGLPKNAEAGRLYAEALDALRAAQPAEASRLLEQAVAVEGDNPLLHSALSSAWSALGYGTKAAEAARRAFGLASRLPREDQLLIEGRLRETEGNAAAARDLYRTLYEAYPDNLEYGLALVAAEKNAGAAKAALSMVNTLRTLPPPLSEDLRLDLAEAEAAAQNNQFELQQVAAERAIAKARQQGARLQLARALLQKAQSRRLLGQAEEAVAAAREAAELFAELEHPVGRAQAANSLATCLLAAGKTGEATTAAEEAATLYRTVGDQGGLAASLNNLAMIRKREGDLDRVEALYGETEQIYRQTGDRRGLALALNNRAVLLVERDQLTAARTMFESSQPMWIEIAGELGAALTTYNLAQVSRLQGELETSRKLHQQALDARAAAGLKPDQAISLANQAGLLLEMGQMAAAEPLLVKARALAEEVGERSLLATVLAQEGELALLRGNFQKARELMSKTLENRLAGQEALLVPAARLALARLSLAEKIPVEANQMAREALDAVHRDGRPAEEVRATAVLALALIADGARDEARTLLTDLAIQASTCQQPLARLHFGLAEAGLASGRDQRGNLARLQELAAEARRHGYLPLALEIELAWVRAARESGLSAEAASRQSVLLEEARKNGLKHLENELRSAGT